MRGKGETFAVVYAIDTSWMNVQNCGKAFCICRRSWWGLECVCCSVTSHMNVGDCGGGLSNFFWWGE